VRAIVRAPGSAFRRAISTHPERSRIDPGRAAAQHHAFVFALRATGCEVVELPPDPRLPDATFVSDALVALPAAGDPDGGAALLLVARPGVPSRRPEVRSVVALARALAPRARVVRIGAPATLEGGDVIVYGDRIAIGVSARTSAGGAAELAIAARPLGYRAFLCPVSDRLHLATAVTAIRPRRLVGTAAGFASLLAAEDGALPGDIERLVVPDEELPGANVLAVGGACLMASGNPRTAAMLRDAGETVIEVALDEFTLADGGPTCLVALVP
jgi:dimethylargininase